MRTLALKDCTVEYQWASDVDFDGIRMEVLFADGNVQFDVSLPEGGLMTINTFGNEITVDFLEAAMEIARHRR